MPADQVEPLRDGIAIFLRASSLDVVDMKPRAEAEFRGRATTPPRSPEPSRTLMTHVNDRAVDKLGPVLLPVVDASTTTAAHPSLSPERAPRRQPPVFLLHGADDNGDSVGRDGAAHATTCTARPRCRPC